MKNNEQGKFPNIEKLTRYINSQDHPREVLEFLLLIKPETDSLKNVDDEINVLI